MDSDESYHSENEFYYPHEMTNDNEKENIGAISNEENQQYVDVFTLANVQNYILGQRVENIVKKTECDLNVLYDKGFESSRKFKISSFNKIPRPVPSQLRYIADPFPRSQRSRNKDVFGWKKIILVEAERKMRIVEYKYKMMNINTSCWT